MWSVDRRFTNERGCNQLRLSAFDVRVMEVVKQIVETVNAKRFDMKHFAVISLTLGLLIGPLRPTAWSICRKRALLPLMAFRRLFGENAFVAGILRIQPILEQNGHQ
jgi:hypothetical protein